MKRTSINDLYIQASSGFRDPSSSPNVTSGLKVPAIIVTHWKCLYCTVKWLQDHHLSPNLIHLSSRRHSLQLFECHL